MLGGDLPAVAAAALTGGEAALDAVHAAGRPARRSDAGPDRDRRRRGTRTTRRRQRFSRPSSTARGCRSTASGDAVSIYTRSLDDVTARLPEVVEATLALPVTDLIADGEAIALRPDGRPHRFQVTASRFGAAGGADDRRRRPRSAAAVGVLLRPAASRRRRPARRAHAATARRAGRDRAARPAGRPADHRRTPKPRSGSWTRRWPPATRA